jgi:hypothetical protein
MGDGLFLFEPWFSSSGELDAAGASPVKDEECSR